MRSPSTSSILSPPPLQPLPAKQLPHPLPPTPTTPQPVPQPQQTPPPPQPQPHAQMSASKVHADLVLNWLTETFFLGSTGSLSKDTVFQEYLAMCASLQFKPVSSSVLGKLVHKAFPGLLSRRRGSRGEARQHYYLLNYRDPNLNELKQHKRKERTRKRGKSSNNRKSPPSGQSRPPKRRRRSPNDSSNSSPSSQQQTPSPSSLTQTPTSPQSNEPSPGLSPGFRTHSPILNRNNSSPQLRGHLPQLRSQQPRTRSPLYNSFNTVYDNNTAQRSPFAFPFEEETFFQRLLTGYINPTDTQISNVSRKESYRQPDMHPYTIHSDDEDGDYQTPPPLEKPTPMIISRTRPTPPTSTSTTSTTSTTTTTDDEDNYFDFRLPVLYMAPQWGQERSNSISVSGTPPPPPPPHDI